MKKVSLFLLALALTSCVLGGCRPISDVPASNTGDATTADSTDTEADFVDPTAVLGELGYDLITVAPATQKPIIDRTQTNLGNFCADAYRSATDADAAIVSASELGDGIAKGEITVADLHATLPKEGKLLTVRASGALILDCLEVAYRVYPDASLYFLHVSGISLVLDANNTPTIKTDNAGNLVSISGERRVKDVRIGDAPLQAEKTYTVTFSEAMPAQIANIFKSCDTVSGSGDSNRDALTSYISETLSGTGSDAYKDPFGARRIVAVPRGQTEPTVPDATLPQVFITAPSPANRTDYIQCSVTVHDPTGVYGDVYDAQSTIKIRGHSTSSGEKPPYNIKFSSKVELLGLGEGKKWNLLANLYDKTQLRNMIAFTFAQQVGVEYTSNSCFAEVYVNGVYQGLYQICEPVDVGETKVDIDTKHYEFLLEVEPYAGYSNYHCLTTPRLKLLFGYNEPEVPTLGQKQWLADFMGDVEDAILSGDYSRVQELVDVDSIARCYIVQELFKNVDYFQSSTRFYVKDGKLYEGPVWDFDLSMGNCSSSFYPAYNNTKTSGLSYESLYCYALYNKELFAYEEFRTLVSEMYLELQPLIVNLYSENELGESKIDRLLADYGEAINRNNTLWSMQKTYNVYEHKPIDGTYDAEIRFLKEWLEGRNRFLYDHYCADMP